MHFGAKGLVARIISTERVAVHNQHLTPIQLKHFFLREKLHTAFAGKAFTEQKIAVAVDEIAGDAAVDKGADGGCDALVQRVGIVIANPRFEQVAQDIERIGLTGNAV